MSSQSDQHNEEHLDLVFLYALRALPASEIPAAEAQISACAKCREKIDDLRKVVESFISWPTDVLRPSLPLWDRISQRVAEESGKPAVAAPLQSQATPDWEQPAPGISCMLLATDSDKGQVSMLVRLDPGAEYPPHRHFGVEELHLLHGELMIDSKKLYPGDYNRAEAGTVDHRVWTETGCTCVLITSTRDAVL